MCFCWAVNWDQSQRKALCIVKFLGLVNISFFALFYEETCSDGSPKCGGHSLGLNIWFSFESHHCLGYTQYLEFTFQFIMDTNMYLYLALGLGGRNHAKNVTQSTVSSSQHTRHNAHNPNTGSHVHVCCFVYVSCPIKNQSEGRCVYSYEGK